MRTIWKFPLKLGYNLLEVPGAAQLLDVQQQRGQLQLWALVESAATVVWRHVLIVGTGFELPGDKTWLHVSTVQVGDFVWHAFEGIKR